ncbi:MAG TPA: Asp-tRNA(Asn)/Glu-tRNA(Gln) amidotransferase subunit GatA [Bacillota bacterium]|nr:Asp-tRNA(Asn)/Glu-tRNA(Gln) amidotransferase subunit GatA [Bacillota bacterium]
MSLFGYTIKELENKLHKKEISPSELVDLSFQQIHDVEDDVKAFITLNEEQARKQAKKLDDEPVNKAKLFALPIGIKDNIVTKGLRTTGASQFLNNFDDPLYDATAVERLKDEQVITIGKLNMDEFGMGSTTENSSYHVTRNPWNLNHVPGGSSGGSAAAVAAGEVLFSLGTDTGGSIRQPASFNGIVGMKPTYGLVSRYGLITFASSLDTIGPLTQMVEDNARILEIIAGHDPSDSTSAKREVTSYTDALTKDVKGLKVAVPEEYLGEGVDPEVKESVMNALQMLELLGVKWDKISMPHSKYAAATYYILSSAEASTALARFDGIRFGKRSNQAKNVDELFKQSRAEGFGDEVKRRILLGTFALSANNVEDYYKKAQKVRTLIRQEFQTVFETYDLVIGPSTPTPAPKIGEKTVDPVTVYANDLLTVPANLAGLPSLSLPCGFTEEEGLPLGLQMIGNHFAEQTIYRLAYAYEQATNHHKKRPALGGE